MDIQIKQLEDVDVTGRVRLVSQWGNTPAIGLYMASTAAAEPTEAPFYKFATKLTAVPFDSVTALTPNEISIPHPLPVTPDWDVALSDSGTGNVCYSFFGGGWSTLKVDTLSGGKLQDGYSYEVEPSSDPAFAGSTGTSTPKQFYVSLLLSSSMLGLAGLQEQDGQQVPGVSDLVGSSDDRVSGGCVWGDMTTGLPQSINLLYKRDTRTGPLSPGKQFCGSLYFNSYDTTSFKPGTEQQVLSDIAFSEFDVAAVDGGFCLFAVTGDGAPLLALYDNTGQPQGSATMPLGSWNNAGRWVTNPTIVATPGTGKGYTFAFIEMVGDTPEAIYTGTLTSTTVET